MILTVLSMGLALTGVAFLVLAAVGVLRFGDSLQRMHASTKAGTVGAGLVLLATMLAHATFAGALIGALAVLFLLLTTPVAAHLLGRAAYVSGAPLVGLRGEDPLAGVLERQPMPLEERILPVPPAGSDAVGSGASTGPAAEAGLREGSRARTMMLAARDDDPAGDGLTPAGTPSPPPSPPHRRG